MFPFRKNNQQQTSSQFPYPEAVHTRNETVDQYPPNYNNNNNNNNDVIDPPPVYSNPIIRYHHEHKRRFFGSITICLCITFLIIILSSIFSVGRYNNRYNGEYYDRRPIFKIKK